MTQQTATVKAGDMVLYRKHYGARPQITTVIDVTTRGWLRVKINPNETYNPPGCGGYGQYASSSDLGESMVYIFSYKKMAELNKDADKKEMNDRDEAYNS